MGASAGYLPEYAKGEILEPDDDDDDYQNNKSSCHTTTSTIDDSHKQQQQQQQQQQQKDDNLKLTKELIQSMYKVYIKNSSAAVEPECKTSICQKRMVFTLNITPILKLVPTNEQPKEENGIINNPIKFYKVQSLQFEIPNIHSIMGLGGSIAIVGDDNGQDSASFPNVSGIFSPPTLGQINETVYLHPLDMSVLNVISHLQIPLTLKLTNIFFTKAEVDHNIMIKMQKEIQNHEWRTQNPISSGALRSSSASLFVGDVFTSGKFCTDDEEEEEEEDGDGDEDSESKSFDSGNYGDIKVSTRYKCSSGSYKSDLRHFRSLHDVVDIVSSNEHAIGSFRDVVVYIPSIGNMEEVITCTTKTSFQQLATTLVYKSALTSQIITSNYKTPREYLISRVGHLDLSTSMDTKSFDIQGLHSIVDPKFIHLAGSKEHLLALEHVLGFMGTHEFFLARDFMMHICITVNRKRKALKENCFGKPTTSLLKDPVDIHYVGRIQNEEVILDMADVENLTFDRKKVIIDNVDTKASLYQQQSTPLANTGTPTAPPSSIFGSDFQGIYAIPTEFCQDIRCQLETNVYQKMRFCDFSNPIIEVNADDTLMTTYLKDLEDHINTSIWNDYHKTQQQNKPKKPFFPTHKCEQPLLPIIVTFEMNYLEIHHPNTLD